MPSGQAVVYLYIPTSNHNLKSTIYHNVQLYIFIFLHQTTTTVGRSCSRLRCISLYSYIKPQQHLRVCLHHRVVYLYIPTSNHNHAQRGGDGAGLYIFIFLHQTTTYSAALMLSTSLYIFIFLHQTTTRTAIICQEISCISLYSYIKPQQR